VRLVRLGDEASKVGADVRAALASWGRGSSLVGGVGLIGCTPPDAPEAVDAIVILPRGLLVVVGVDLPDPAMRLDAPVGGQWKIDGWPLVREDGAVNPATEGMQAATAIVARLQAQRVEPMPVGIVIAVGPYVARVSQPTTDLARGIRILHPEPTTLLTATRELAVYERRCPAHAANAVLAALVPDHPPFSTEELIAEGFAEESAAASTMFIPRVSPTRPTAPAVASQPTAPGRPKRLGWLPVSAAMLVGLLLIVGIVVAVVASGGEGESDAGRSVTAAQQTGPVVEGISYMPKGNIKDEDCASRAFGDIQTALTAGKCRSLVRARYEAVADNGTVAVLLADLTFPDEAAAVTFLNVANTPGTGSITDPSANGVPWPDGRKPIFDSAAYQTKQSGSLVRIVQAVWLDKSSAAEDPALVNIATRSLNLPPTT
jgi:hypothetical protein